MGQALYRKYRSRKFSEVIGQQHITKTLANALTNGNVSHAYLFTGPRGVGKTSVARILAHEVNGLSYKADIDHLDIIEIDAASNRRIDEVRDLRDKVHAAPAAAKYKVYIIDEVHMLTREAFNALLKTLEEPPAHCIFILATTEAHKLPETIVSRTQRFTFKPISTRDAVAQLKKIARKEGIEIEPSALGLLAEHGDGSFRDSLGMLDQVSSLGKSIKEEDVRSLLGLPPAELVSDLVKAVKAGSSQRALAILVRLREHGANAAQIAQHLSTSLRSLLTDADTADRWVPKLLKQLINVPASPSPDEYLEVCVLEAAAANGPISEFRQLQHSEAVQVNPSSSVVRPLAKKSSRKTRLPEPAKSSAAASDIDFWPLAVEFMKERAASLYTVLRLAAPSIENDRLILRFEFVFHQSKLKQAKNLLLLQTVLEELSGRKFEIECLHDKDYFKRLESTRSSDNSSQPLQAINNIFGPLEVLES